MGLFCCSRLSLGRFLFVLVPQQIPNGHTKVLGDLIGGFCVKGFLAAGLQVGQDAAADSDFGAELCVADGMLGAEGGDTNIKCVHTVLYSPPISAALANTVSHGVCFLP